MSYPDLNEPVRTQIGVFPVISLTGSGEFVECPRCFAVMRKVTAKKHAEQHEEKS